MSSPSRLSSVLKEMSSGEHGKGQESKRLDAPRGVNYSLNEARREQSSVDVTTKRRPPLASTASNKVLEPPLLPGTGRSMHLCVLRKERRGCHCLRHEFSPLVTSHLFGKQKLSKPLWWGGYASVALRLTPHTRLANLGLPMHTQDPSNLGADRAGCTTAIAAWWVLHVTAGRGLRVLSSLLRHAGVICR